MKFTKHFDTDYLYCGRLDLPWSQIEQDLTLVVNDQTRNLPVVDDQTLLGTPLYELHGEYKKYGYTQHNTKLWKTTSGGDKLDFSWEKQVADQLPLDHAIVTVTRQDVGQTLPWHMDRFFYLKKIYPQDTRAIWRFLLFLSDWQIGHIIQVKNSVYYGWKRGDVVAWQPDSYHLSANVGLATKWTCNITGFLTV
jgi:hypothetical protein